MKTLKLLSLLTILISLISFSFAQEIKTETIKVLGNCGMCKTRIEKAAKGAGAETADWNTETKMLTITFNSASVSAAKIQEAIAAVGHDTHDFRAPDDIYNKLPACCKYDRAKDESGNHSMMMNCSMMNGKTKKA
jgi:periplasmic mercuric ion binding protein